MKLQVWHFSLRVGAEEDCSQILTRHSRNNCCGCLNENGLYMFIYMNPQLVELFEKNYPLYLDGDVSLRERVSSFQKPALFFVNFLLHFCGSYMLANSYCFNTVPTCLWTWSLERWTWALTLELCLLCNDFFY